MNTYLHKLKLVYLPFLKIAIAFILTYTFLNWLLVVELQIIPLKEIIANLFLPMGLVWIPVIIWLRPRIKLLNLNRGSRDPDTLYILVAALAIAATTIVAQEYMVRATGKLTTLEYPTLINKSATTRYYSIKQYYIDRNRIKAQWKYEVSGKHNEDLNIHIYVVVPISNKAADTLLNYQRAYLGIEFDDRISNRLSNEEKDRLSKQFAEMSIVKFNAMPLSGYTYFERIGNSDEHKEYNKAVHRGTYAGDKEELILTGSNEPFESRCGDRFAWIFGSFGIGAGLFLLMVSLVKLEQTDKRRLDIQTKRQRKEMFEYLMWLKPQEGFFITPLLIIANFLIYLLMVINGCGFITFQGTDLLTWGANYGPYTADGEAWRLLSYMFLHGGIMHLLMNMYSLLFVGSLLEPFLGKWKYLSVYMVTGIISGIASVWWHDATVSVGASGAIFGLYGLFLSLMLLKVLPREFSKAFLSSILIFVGFNLFAGLAGGIDNAAHIGGLLSGALVGLFIYVFSEERESEDEEQALEE
ncbi:rhomboid family intramembrane serine protease [Parabacteroides sp. FAFU027]|uniref:rhomboid family intramembrane serine protease n=1 Tax=Parabacteroides sp. FAFU027 TaxID=2922715 RepID=UPI001FAF20DF|nr:rhomboid family intramembrane serine protease [Parabacteroides sp. FAFU027]